MDFLLAVLDFIGAVSIIAIFALRGHKDYQKRLCREALSAHLFTWALPALVLQ